MSQLKIKHVSPQYCKTLQDYTAVPTDMKRNVVNIVSKFKELKLNGNK